MNIQLSQLLGMLRYEFLMQWRRKTMILLIAPMVVLFTFIVLLSADQVRQQADSARSLGLSAENAEKAVTLVFLPAVWSILHIMLVLVIPISASENIPKDRQLGVRELLDTFPLPSGVYLAGKLISMWLVMLVSLAGVGLFTALLWRLALGPYDIVQFAGVWVLLAAPIALANPGLTLLLSAGQPTRRRALLVGVGIAILTLLTAAFSQSLTMWDYLSPFRPVIFRYFLQGGSATLASQTVTPNDVALAVVATVAETALVAIGTGLWLRRQRDI